MGYLRNLEIAEQKLTGWGHGINPSVANQVEKVFKRLKLDPQTQSIKSEDKLEDILDYITEELDISYKGSGPKVPASARDIGAFLSQHYGKETAGLDKEKERAIRLMKDPAQLYKIYYRLAEHLDDDIDNDDEDNFIAAHKAGNIKSMQKIIINTMNSPDGEDFKL